ncbi:MAG: chemotaxis response regulator protein-glutamate methylesterase [Chloroflexi bacterium HGW-Chloroflexi-9]|nr:MAG: chemotaxis response regulator protein-glutamate methylesterase [Chloroflexi bacterium HGW-Chloroflexi-9]
MTSSAVHGTGEVATAPLRVLLVDDSATVRVTLRRALEATGRVEVAGVAEDGIQALQMLHALHPDVVTLDVEMPRLGGLETLQRLMAERPTPVVMLSSHTTEGADTTIRALELGAVDFIEKPSFADLRAGAAGLIVEKLRAASRARVVRAGVRTPRSTHAAPGGAWAHRILVIGASTGGPQAVREVLTSLPADFGLPVVVVQHMPPTFTRSLAERLNSLGPLRVEEAEAGMRMQVGHVLLAPGGYHMEFDGERRVVLTESPLEHGVRPAVNVTMASVAAIPAANPIGVVLTGMGRDGVRGCGLLRAAGGTIITEAQSTCVVYGMPRAVADAGLSDEVVPLDEVAPTIIRHARIAARRNSGG